MTETRRPDSRPLKTSYDPDSAHATTPGPHPCLPGRGVPCLLDPTTLCHPDPRCHSLLVPADPGSRDRSPPRRHPDDTRDPRENPAAREGGETPDVGGSFYDPGPGRRPRGHQVVERARPSGQWYTGEPMEDNNRTGGRRTDRGTGVRDGFRRRRVETGDLFGRTRGASDSGSRPPEAPLEL